MKLYPDGYFNKVSEISLEYLKENNIKGLILDVDNTLIDYYKSISEDTINWVNALKENEIKMYILSNSNKKEKVKEVASKLGVEYTYFGMKPLKIGFKKAKKMLDLEKDEIAVVGDQIFTDILGANRMGMHSILVDPINEKDILITLIKRPIENRIKSEYSKKKTTKPEPKKSEYLTRKYDIDHSQKSDTVTTNRNNKGERGEK